MIPNEKNYPNDVLNGRNVLYGYFNQPENRKKINEIITDSYTYENNESQFTEKLKKFIKSCKFKNEKSVTAYFRSKNRNGAWKTNVFKTLKKLQNGTFLSNKKKGQVATLKRKIEEIRLKMNNIIFLNNRAVGFSKEQVITYSAQVVAAVESYSGRRTESEEVNCKNIDYVFRNIKETGNLKYVTKTPFAAPPFLSEELQYFMCKITSKIREVKINRKLCESKQEQIEKLKQNKHLPTRLPKIGAQRPTTDNGCTVHSPQGKQKLITGTNSIPTEAKKNEKIATTSQKPRSLTKIKKEKVDTTSKKRGKKANSSKKKPSTGIANVTPDKSGNQKPQHNSLVKKIGRLFRRLVTPFRKVFRWLSGFFQKQQVAE